MTAAAAGTAYDLLILRIRRLRQARHISQTAMAEAMKQHGFSWHQNTVSKVEDGRRALRADELSGVASVLGVPAGDLLTGGDGLDRAVSLERALRERIAAEILPGTRKAGDAA